jgi:very-short-patch-repair endonuclease
LRTTLARTLRKAMTPPERRLWRVLKMRPDGFKFRSQHPHGPYVLDFFCHESALAIEVDGMVHDMGEKPERDLNRDQHIAAQGIHTIRISATEVRDNLDGVITHIIETCRARTARN